MIKGITSLSPPVIYDWPLQGGTSGVVPQCFMVFVRVYMVFSNMNNSCPLCFLF